MERRPEKSAVSSDLLEGGRWVREGKLGFLERGVAVAAAVDVLVVGPGLVAAFRGVVGEGLVRETFWEVQWGF